MSDDATWPVELRRAVMVLFPTLVIFSFVCAIEDALGFHALWGRVLVNQVPIWLTIAWLDTCLGPRSYE